MASMSSIQLLAKSRKTLSEGLRATLIFFFKQKVKIYISSHLPPFSSFLVSPSLKVTSVMSNPLVTENFTWTEEMVSDLRKLYGEAKTFIPICYKVSI